MAVHVGRAMCAVNRRRVEPGMKATELALAPALEQAVAIKRREVSSGDLVEVYLQRIEELNPRLNAYRLVTPELARAQAKNPGQGPLAGVPCSVKDLVGLKANLLTYGSRAFEDNVAQVDYFMVGRLKEEGCPILGKTTTPEFGSRPTTEHGLHGVARNPWNSEHNAGGPSGGAPAAAAGAPRAAGRRPRRGPPRGPKRGGGPPGAGGPPATPLRVAYTTAGTEVDSEIKAAVYEAVHLIERLGHHVVGEDGPDTSGL